MSIKKKITSSKEDFYDQLFVLFYFILVFFFNDQLFKNSTLNHAPSFYLACFPSKYVSYSACMISHSRHTDSLQSHDCSPPGSSVHGIFQARVLEWVVMPSSWGSSRPTNWTSFTLAGRFFTTLLETGFWKLPVLAVIQSPKLLHLLSSPCLCQRDKGDMKRKHF